MTDDPSADDAAAPSSPADGSGTAPEPAPEPAPEAAGGSALERLRALAAERASAAAREAMARRQVLREPAAAPVEPVVEAAAPASDDVVSADETDETDHAADDPVDGVVDRPEQDEPAEEDETLEDGEPGDAVEDAEPPADEPPADEQPADEQPADEPTADEPTDAADRDVRESGVPGAGVAGPVADPPLPLPPESVGSAPLEPSTFGAPVAPLPDGLRGRGRLVVVALGGLLAAAAITFGVLFVLAHGKVADRQKLLDRREAARAAAVQTFSDLTTVDYNDQAGYTSRLSADTTGGLHDQIGSSAGSLFQTIFVPAKEVLKGTPVRAGVSFTGGGTTTARALVLGHVLLTASSLPAGKEEVAGYAFQLKLVDGRWLVDTAASLGGGDTGTSPSASPSPSAGPATEPSATPHVSGSAKAPASAKASASPSAGALPPPAPPASSAGGHG